MILKLINKTKNYKPEPIKEIKFLRICYICPTRTPHIKAYIKYFSSRGHEIHIISLTKDPINNATLHYVGINDKLNPLYYFICSVLVYIKIKEIKPDVCHAHWITSNGLMAALARCKPLIVTEHGIAASKLNNLFRKAIVRFVARNAELINPVSNQISNLLVRAGLQSDKMLIAAVGVDSESFRPVLKNFKSRPLFLINTRPFRSLDNLKTLILALSILAKSNIKFHCTFAGKRGTQFDEILILAKQLGIYEYITFMEGYIHTDLPKILKGHHVYISCNSYDGSSVSLLEAMSSGLVPVVSDIPANRDWVSDGDNGLITELSNPDNLADAIEKLYKNQALCEKYSKNSIDIVKKNGIRNVIFKKIEKNYEKLSGIYSSIK